MSLDPVHVGSWRKTDRLRLKQAHGTRPMRWLTAGSPTVPAFNYRPPGGAADIAAVLGSTAYAGAGLIGGSRFHRMQAVNIGANAVTLRRWLAEIASTITAATHGTVSITANTISRTVGDWTTEGWSVDDQAILEGFTTPGNNVAAVPTGVTATTLTFPASTFPTPENAPAAGARIYRAHQQPVSGLAANAGNTPGTPALNFLTDGNSGVDTITNNSAVYIGAGLSLFVGVLAALAAGTYVDLTADGGDL